MLSMFMTFSFFRPVIACLWMSMVLCCAGVEAELGWPQFRGPEGNGHAGKSGDVKGLPVAWSEEKNVKWKVTLPYVGWSTPLVVGGEIWLTAASATGHDFYVLVVERESGKVLLERAVFHCAMPEPLGNDLNCYAAPTGCVAGGRVFLHFGCYGTVCFDVGSRVELWRREDLRCKHLRGPGSSLVAWGDVVVVTMDGTEEQYLCALEQGSGKTRWRVQRSTEFDDLGTDGKPKAEGDYRKAYSTPLLISVGGKERLVSAGSKAAICFDPMDGREVWKCRYKGFSNAGMPVWWAEKGMMVINTGHPKATLQGYVIDGASGGDISETMKWEQVKGIPARSSPLLVDGVLHMIGETGLMTAVDALSGELLYSERSAGGASASPLYAGGRVYFCNERGQTVVVKPGREFVKLGEGQLAEGILASPVAVGGELYIRTKAALYCVWEKP